MKTNLSNQLRSADTAEPKTIMQSHEPYSWSNEIWKKSSLIYHAILELDFLKELSAGTLSEEAFGRYIAQDEIYLRNYYHQMFLLADLMDDEADKSLFFSFAQSGMEGEKVMHDMLIEKYGINTQVEASVVTSEYNHHICKGIATGNRCVALAAILPCMWIYNRVGLENNPYKEWILEYGNEEFSKGVNQVLQMLDRWAADADDETRNLMDYYYLKAALYEYAFWDYGYHADVKSYDYINTLEGWI